MSMNRKQRAFSFIPFTLSVLGLPIIGKITGASAAKKGVKKTLANVDYVVYYLRIFLLAASIIIVFLLSMLAIKVIRRWLRLKKLRKAVKLLHHIQADLVLLKEGLPKEQLHTVELSKQEAMHQLKEYFSDPFFQKRLGKHTFRRIMDAINLIEKDKMSVKNQIILVTQWLKSVDLLCR